MDIGVLQSNLEEAQEALSSYRGELPLVSNVFTRVLEPLKEFRTGMASLLDDNKLLTIGIVGQMKVGKSSFLNSLLFNGETILPIAATPMTAGLTTLEYTDGPNYLEICYFSKEDWANVKESAETYKANMESLLREKPSLKNNPKFLKQEMKRVTTPTQQSAYELIEFLTPEAGKKIGEKPQRIEFRDVADLQSRLRDLVGAGGRFTSVVSILHIHLNDNRLKGMRIVDTPGVNDPVVSREVRTVEYLHQCHGVFMMVRSEHFIGQADKEFMDERLSTVGIGAILLVGSQIDVPLCAPGFKKDGFSKGLNELTDQLYNDFDRIKPDLKPSTSAAIFDCQFISGMAASVLIKLRKYDFDESEAGLSDDEAHMLKLLREYFPQDFLEKESIEDNLIDIANFGVIKDIIDNDFVARKDEIIDKKLLGYFNEQKDSIRARVTDGVKRLKSELEFVRSTDYEQLRRDVAAIESLSEEMIEPLKITIMTYAARLDSRMNSISERQLDDKKVECKYVPETSMTVQYTRETTFWGRKKNEQVSVSVVNRNSLKENQEQAMKSYRQTLDDAWRKMFAKFMEEMVAAISSAVAAIGGDLEHGTKALSNILRNTFDVDLEKYKDLRLKSTFDEHVDRIRGYVDDSDHTSFNKSFGSMNESDASGKIKEQAQALLKNVQGGINSRDRDFMEDMINVANKAVKNTVRVLDNLQNNLLATITSEAEKLLAEKRAQLENKEKTVRELEGAIERLNGIQNIF